MGRIFETRKHVMFARWDKMSKLFARIGKEITIAVKAGGPNPEGNPALKRVMQNARAANMPKDKVESAIKKASGQNATQYEEILYEGYAPHGIAVLIETATDNVSRTAPNIRTIFNKNGGNMGNTGSVAFLFHRVGSFRLNPAGLDQDALELELIDHGLEEMGETSSDKGEPQILVRCAFTDFGTMQKALEDRGIPPISAELEYVPTSPVELSESHVAEVLQIIDKLEQDDDVQKVYSNLA